MSEQRQAVGIASNGLDPLNNDLTATIAPRTGRDHLMTIWRLLARIQLNAAAPVLAPWLPAHIASLPWGATLIVVTPHLSEDALWVLHNAYRRGSNVIVLVCASQLEFRSLQARAQRLGVQVVSAIWESDLKALR